jgi:hypothetical protein
MRNFTCIKEFKISIGDECLISVGDGGFVLKTLPDINGKSCDPWHIGIGYLYDHFVDNRLETIKS